MNNQTFITYFKVNGKTVTFERWNYKRLATVEKAINTLFDSDLWKDLLKIAANNAGESESSTTAAVVLMTTEKRHTRLLTRLRDLAGLAMPDLCPPLSGRYSRI